MSIHSDPTREEMQTFLSNQCCAVDGDKIGILYFLLHNSDPGHLVMPLKKIVLLPISVPRW